MRQARMDGWALAALCALSALSGCPPNAYHSLTLIAAPVEGGSIVATPEQAAYFAGTRVKLEAVPNPGWRFRNWQGVGINNTKPETTIQVYSSQVITAFFVPDGGEGEGEGETDIIVRDGSFERGPESPNWFQFSQNFAYLICDAARCGTLGGLGARSGEHWAYFGGSPEGVAEVASLSQDVVMPRTGEATLFFALAVPRAEAPFRFRVFLGRNLLFELTEAGAADYTDYVVVAIDVSGQANGSREPLTFVYSNDETPNALTAVFLDDVSIEGGDEEDEGV